MVRDRQIPGGPQHPLGSPSEFQPPSGRVLGDDLPLKFPEDFAGATDNAMGGASLADIRSGRGFVPVARGAAAASTNPSEVDDEASPRSGFLGRSHGRER